MGFSSGVLLGGVLFGGVGFIIGVALGFHSAHTAVIKSLLKEIGLPQLKRGEFIEMGFQMGLNETPDDVDESTSYDEDDFNYRMN